jgi:peptidoglycan-associated lipoprotein
MLGEHRERCILGKLKMKLKSLAVICLGLLISACAASNDQAASSGSASGASAGSTSGQLSRDVTTTTSSTFAPGSQEELQASIGDRVFFETDRYDLSPEAQAMAGTWAEWMKKHQNVQIEIEGHADERGTREYNLALGARRANTVKDYLTSLGVQANRITTVSYGTERPDALGSNEEAWAKNRRSVAVVR